MQRGGCGVGARRPARVVRPLNCRPPSISDALDASLTRARQRRANSYLLDKFTNGTGKPRNEREMNSHMNRLNIKGTASRLHYVPNETGLVTPHKSSS